MAERKLVGTGEMFKKHLPANMLSVLTMLTTWKFCRVLQKLLKKQDHQSFFKFLQVQENMLTKLTLSS